MDPCVIAVDVGTGSARAAIYDRTGKRHGRGESPIALLRPDGRLAVHDSANIWHAVCASIRMAVAQAGGQARPVSALFFDATCSLVLNDPAGRGVATIEGMEDNWDTICWMDHRALAEADELTALGGPVIAHCGGRMSPEMQMPKLKWLKERQPATWARLGHACDLVDWLVARAVGHKVVSHNPLVAKWGYLGEQGRFDEAWLASAGLADVPSRLGLSAPPGRAGAIAGTLSVQAASELGLSGAIPVSFGLVDAFAGAVSLLGDDDPSTRRLALIGGTSNCVMMQTAGPQAMAGFWGPYPDAVLPGRFVTEGGQSAAGSLLDLVMRWQAHGGDDCDTGHDRMIADIAASLARDPDWGREIHLLPEFHGSRSPIPDPASLGVIHGLSLDPSADGRRKLYWRTMVAIALGIRDIIEDIEAQTGPVDEIRLGGGHARNPLMTQLYADAVGKPVAVGAGEEAMLLGGAMAAAVAAGWFSTLTDAARGMARRDRLVRPDPAAAARLGRDHAIRRRMIAHRDEITDLSTGRG